MKKYNELKQKESDKTKNYSDKRLRRYIKINKVVRGLYSELSFWLISLIPFVVFPIIIGPTVNIYLVYVIAHFLFWFFWGKKKYHEMCDDDVEELNLTIELLEEIRCERDIKK